MIKKYITCLKISWVYSQSKQHISPHRAYLHQIQKGSLATAEVPPHQKEVEAEYCYPADPNKNRR